MKPSRKVLPQRIHTFEQLNSLCESAGRDGVGQRGRHVLYGRVVVEIPRHDVNWLQIAWHGKHTHITIASVYRVSEGDTVYAVRGFGRDTNKPSNLKREEIWRRYAAAFTPHPPDLRLPYGHSAGYRLHAGAATPCTLPANDAPIDVWLTLPNIYRPSRDTWASNYNSSMPQFQRRCRLFAAQLSQVIQDGLPCVMQLLHEHEGKFSSDRTKNLYVGQGGGKKVFLQVCTPPTRTRSGRRLIVQLDANDDLSELQFFANVEGRPWKEMYRWACNRDAIMGITEWVLGDIYIPGPD